jgi:hypothetical protein
MITVQGGVRGGGSGNWSQRSIEAARAGSRKRIARPAGSAISCWANGPAAAAFLCARPTEEQRCAAFLPSTPHKSSRCPSGTCPA